MPDEGIEDAVSEECATAVWEGLHTGLGFFVGWLFF